MTVLPSSYIRHHFITIDPDMFLYFGGRIATNLSTNQLSANLEENFSHFFKLFLIK